MKRTKKQLGLIGTVAALQAFIDGGDVKDLFEVRGDIRNICMTFSRKITEYERLSLFEMQLDVNQDAGSPENPVRVSNVFEGYRFDGRWFCRNSDPKKRGICRKWVIEEDEGRNAAFDAFYLKSFSDEDAEMIKDTWRAQQTI